MKDIFTKKVKDAPPVLLECLFKQEEGLKAAAEKYGDYISPFEFPDKVARR